MKMVLCGILLPLTIGSYAQAGFWDWLPGRGRGHVNCNYSENELRRIVPIEEQRAWKNTPTSYPVEKFDLQSAQDARPWLRDFRYIIVVNKAATGPTAQTITVFEDGIQVVHEVISTGREKLELKRRSSSCEKQPPQSYYSITATGYYNVEQLVKDHRSDSFDADMPYSMFYDRHHGLALHQAAKPALKNLGTRASGGCTRMRGELAAPLFNKISKTRGAQIPVFNKDGSPQLDENGQVKRSKTVPLFDGRAAAYSGIVIIQDIAD
jgi:lipoprotein-anchoring transpeptidase ErfK/SrfK